MSFTIRGFIDSCLAAIAGASAANQHDAQKNIVELLGEAVASSESVYQALGTPKNAGVEKLYVSPQLTVLNVIWAPRMTLLPHNHNMWAVVGVYCGRENNTFWRRVGGARSRIEAAGARSIGAGEVCCLDKNIIHSVTNPSSNFTGAIHVYGGDFFEVERSEWNPDTLIEQPFDVDENMGLFERENERLQ